MRMRTVEVDEEVFSLVKAEAEPLVDDFNSALRRLLPLESGGRKGASSSDGKGGSDIAEGWSRMPQALLQTLEVIRLVLGGAYSRTSATRFVAKQHGVHSQTVLDKYCRQLGLTAGEFDRFLDEDLEGLKCLLVSKFPSNETAIESMLISGGWSR